MSGINYLVANFIILSMSHTWLVKLKHYESGR